MSLEGLESGPVRIKYKGSQIQKRIQPRRKMRPLSLWIVLKMIWTLQRSENRPPNRDRTRRVRKRTVPVVAEVVAVNVVSGVGRTKESEARPKKKVMVDNVVSPTHGLVIRTTHNSAMWVERKCRSSLPTGSTVKYREKRHNRLITIYSKLLQYVEWKESKPVYLYPLAFLAARRSARDVA